METRGDMAALVQSVREASTAATKAAEPPTQPQELATPPETAPEPAQPRYQRMAAIKQRCIVWTQEGASQFPVHKSHRMLPRRRYS